MLIAFIVTCIFMFGVGWTAHKIKSVDYKKRWQEALVMLDRERLGTGELVDIDNATGIKQTVRTHAQPVRPNSQLSPSDRLMIELHKAKKGLPPSDELKGCEGYSMMRNVIEARLDQGWDWKGQYWEFTPPLREIEETTVRS